MQNETQNTYNLPLVIVCAAATLGHGSFPGMWYHTQFIGENYVFIFFSPASRYQSGSFLIRSGTIYLIPPVCAWYSFTLFLYLI